MWRIAVLTSSDQGAAGLRADESGALLRTALQALGEICAEAIVPDDEEKLTQQMQQWVSQHIDLIVTTGGTGLGPRDVTPEATRRVIDRELQGMAEAMRQESLKHTPMGMLSRAVCGQAGQTLIVNMPGSPRAVRELLPLILPVLPHALNLIHGNTQHEK